MEKRRAWIGIMIWDDEWGFELPTSNIIIRILCGILTVPLSLIGYLGALLVLVVFCTWWFLVPLAIAAGLDANPTATLVVLGIIALGVGVFIGLKR